jgi:hypothetical protein
MLPLEAPRLRIAQTGGEGLGLPGSQDHLHSQDAGHG